MKKILSVQDISCYGQCSLTVALPIISSYGVEVAILPSAILSTHTCGFKNFTVLDLTSEMPKIINHWQDEKIKFDAIYTGYIGDVNQFDYILNAHKTLNNGLLIVDPAMADNGKLYPALNDNIVDGMRKLVKQADIILPNITEACFLLDIPYQEATNEEYAKKIVYELSKMGPKVSILTGYMPDSQHIGAIAYDKVNDKYYTYITKKIPVNFHGTGDIFTSSFVGQYLSENNIYQGIKEACEFTYASIDKTLGDENHSYGVHFEEVLRTKNK